VGESYNEKGIELTQLKSEIFRWINLSQMGQNLCQRVDAITEERRTSMEEKPVGRGIRTHTQTSRLRWEVDAVENLREPIFLHPLLRSRMVESPTVREHGYFGRCL